MSKSEIFDSFVKIAQEKGMISNDSSDSKKKLEKTLRADSLSASDIEALYGVKPDAPKSMEYEHNIMERAHPNSIVISPSYDKLNGLVENNVERQNIMLHIVNKTPDGLLTQRKYAEQDLVLSLVRLANDLDNHDKDELRVLADTCLMQVHYKQMKKEASPLIIIGIVSALLGGIYLQQHMDFSNEGYDANHQKLIAELDDILSSTNSWGVGTNYSDNLKQGVQAFRDNVEALHDKYTQSVLPLLNSLDEIKTAPQLIQQAKQPNTNTLLNAYRAFEADAQKLLIMANQVDTKFKSQAFKDRGTANKGWMSKLVDKVPGLHGGSGLVGDDFDDVRRALPSYIKSISELLAVMKDAKTMEEKSKRDLATGQAAAKTQLGTVAPQATTPAAPAESVLDQGSKDLSDFGLGEE